MAAGLPLTASDIPGVREVLLDAGLLSPPGDVDRLAANLRLLISEPGLRLELSQKARRRAVEQFSLEAHAANMEAVFEFVLITRSPRD